MNGSPLRPPVDDEALTLLRKLVPRAYLVERHTGLPMGGSRFSGYTITGFAAGALRKSLARKLNRAATWDLFEPGTSITVTVISRKNAAWLTHHAELHGPLRAAFDAHQTLCDRPPRESWFGHGKMRTLYDGSAPFPRKSHVRWPGRGLLAYKG